MPLLCFSGIIIENIIAVPSQRRRQWRQRRSCCRCNRDAVVLHIRSIHICIHNTHYTHAEAVAVCIFNSICKHLDPSQIRYGRNVGIGINNVPKGGGRKRTISICCEFQSRDERSYWQSDIACAHTTHTEFIVTDIWQAGAAVVPNNGKRLFVFIQR